VLGRGGGGDGKRLAGGQGGATAAAIVPARAGARLIRWAVQRVMVEAGKGEGSATRLAFGPQLGLAAAGRKAAGGRLGWPWGGGLRVGERAAAPLRGRASRSTGEGATRAGEDDQAETVPRRAGRTYGGATFQARYAAGRDVPGVSGRERHWEGAREVLGKARAGTDVETEEGGRGAASAARWRAWARTRRGARERVRGGLLFRCAPVRRVKSSKICTKVLQVVNRKVVDLITLYNFHKSRIVFFSTDCSGTSCQL
jgi:hypothetical protein